MNIEESRLLHWSAPLHDLLAASIDIALGSGKSAPAQRLLPYGGSGEGLRLAFAAPHYFPPNFVAVETASTKFMQAHVGHGAAPLDLRQWNPTEYPNYPEGRCEGEHCDEFFLHRLFPDDGQDGEVAITDVKPRAGVWYDFVLHVVWDTESGGAGLTEFWINGHQYYSATGGNTFESPENKDHPYGAMLKLGMYHGSWRNQEAIDTSRAEGVDHLEVFMGPVRILSRQDGNHIGAAGYDCVVPPTPRP